LKKIKTKKYLTIYSQVQINISACSNVVNPIRRYPLIMSIILHHYKILKEPTFSFIAFLIFLKIVTTIIFMTIIVTFHNITSGMIYGITSLLCWVKGIECYLKKYYNHHINIRLQSMQKEKKFLQNRYLWPLDLNNSKKWYLIQTIIIGNNNFSNISIITTTIIISSRRNILMN
jgi:hypothetical protein